MISPITVYLRLHHRQSTHLSLLHQHQGIVYVSVPLNTLLLIRRHARNRDFAVRQAEQLPGHSLLEHTSQSRVFSVPPPHLIFSQESYFTYPPEPESPVNHDILFRPGVAPDGFDTFTPRTLIYDLKGAFGSMRKINALYEAEDDRSILDQNGVWPSKPIVQRATETIPQSTYQEHLDAGLQPPPLSTSSVRYWSDYSRVYYHPKSIVQLSEFDVNDKLMPFESWDVGMELFEKLEREVDLVDRDLRPFVEECDGIQGLQIFTGVDDAWGGWASGWLERLRDEYGKMSIWTWGLGDHGANSSTPRVRSYQGSGGITD